MAGLVQASTDMSSGDETVTVINPSGAGNVLLVCEHGSNAIPDIFDNLGLADDALNSHIAWDPGALAVAESMSAALDAPLVAQSVSRLIYDCNRPPEASGAITELSEIWKIPGNIALSEEERQQRVDGYYKPFRDTLAAFLDQWMTPNALQALVTIHSFTPVYEGVERAVEIGILHDDDARLADDLIGCATMANDYVVRRNEPYGPKDGVTHTLRTHALPRKLLNVMIEIRSDLISDRQSQNAMATRLVECIADALTSFAGNSGASQRAT